MRKGVFYIPIRDPKLVQLFSKLPKRLRYFAVERALGEAVQAEWFRMILELTTSHRRVRTNLRDMGFMCAGVTISEKNERSGQPLQEHEGEGDDLGLIHDELEGDVKIT